MKYLSQWDCVLRLMRGASSTPVALHGPITMFETLALFSHALPGWAQIYSSRLIRPTPYQFALDGTFGVAYSSPWYSYVMGGLVGIYDPHCVQLEDLTPPHPLLYPNAPPPNPV